MSKDFKVDFIAIGAPKAGLTWLNKCLKEHPEINMGKKKEISFFNLEHEDFFNIKENKNYFKGIDWYKKFFKPEQGKIIGEFSVEYFASKSAARLIKKHFPKTKIVVCLRNPVDRIYSLYWWYKGAYLDKSESFAAAIENHPEYIQLGYSYPKLKRYYDRFPPENIHVVLLDEIKNEPLKVLKQLYEFLGVDSNFIPSVFNQKINTSRVYRYKWVDKLRNYVRNLAKKGYQFKLLKKVGLYQLFGRMFIKFIRKDVDYPDINNDVEKRLLKLYQEDIKKTKNLINKDLGHWSK